MINNKIKTIKTGGFTLVEVIIGVALMLIVFSGIFGAYRLSLKVVGLSKDKVVATAIANSQIEKIRNLPYASVGTLGAVLPQVSGTLDRMATETLDGENFTITTSVEYVIDPADGTGASDPCNWDYKSVSVIVYWSGPYAGSVAISTIVAPKSVVEETQTCLAQPGGVLTVTVFDSHGLIVATPLISIYNIGGSIFYGSATPTTGIYSFPLAAGTYRVVVTKDGYTTARSYGTNEIATPNTLNPTVLVNGNVPISLSIDRVSQVFVTAISPTGQDNFADSFDDQTKLSILSGTRVVSGSLTLAGPPYGGSGFAISNAIAPSNLVSWNSFNFSGNLPPSTGAKYQILYFDGSNWNPVPDLDLGGNSAGFTVSPIDLSGLNISIYSQLKIKSILSSTDSTATPSVLNWQIIWTTNSGVPIPGASFHMQGNINLGKDSSGQYVYKFVNDYVTDGSGQLTLQNIEGDSYNFSPTATSTLTLIGSNPSPQPITVPVNSTVAINLYLRASNTLLVSAQDDQTLAPVFSATAELKNGSGYDKTQYTDQKGQTYFSPLSAGSYTLLIHAGGYNSYSGSVQVSGQSVKLINLHQIQ